MPTSASYDAAVIGSGPNGLAAAITLAQHGLKVIVLEGAAYIGGSARSAELTLPGYIHDVGPAAYPIAVASPFFSALPLKDLGLKWITPPVSMAHPFDDGPPALLKGSPEESAATLGKDAAAYTGLIQPILNRWDNLMDDVLGTRRLPRHPLAWALFGMEVVQSAQVISRRFRGPRARGFFAGLASHSVLPLNSPASAGIGLVLAAMGHRQGWPIPQGGADAISDCLSKYLVSMGCTVKTGVKVSSAADLPAAKAFFFDTSPAQIIKVFGDRLTAGYRRSLRRYAYGPGAFKIDWALSGPIPWKSSACASAGTVHLGGSYDEIAEAESAAWHGRVPSRPFVLLAQPSLFDPSRAPSGKHTAWAYCHVPNGGSRDMTGGIEAQVERFAPGFTDLILARHVSSLAALEAENPNLVGGDITGGAQTLKQIFCRPSCRINPYSTPLKGVFICSASTPPGAGVHGMCGFHAARMYLERERLWKM